MLFETSSVFHRRRHTHSLDLVDKPSLIENDSTLNSMTEAKRPPVLCKYFVVTYCVAVFKGLYCTNILISYD